MMIDEKMNAGREGHSAEARAAADVAGRTVSDANNEPGPGTKRSLMQSQR